MSRKNLTIGIIGTVVILITLIMFFTLKEQFVTIEWLALMFILMAEIIFFGGLILTENIAKDYEGLFLRSGVYSALTIFSIASLVISLIFMFAFTDSTKTLNVLQHLLWAIATIIVTLIITLGSSILQRNSKTEEAINNMALLQEKATDLGNNPLNSAFSYDIHRIAEAIRFSDISSTSPSDGTLFEKLKELEDLLMGSSQDKEKEIKDSCNNILWLLQKRNREVVNNKGGKI